MNRTTPGVACLVAWAVASCTPEPLTPAGAQVRIGHMQPLGCKEVGKIQDAGDSVDHSAPEDATRDSHSGMRNRGAAMGANYILLEGSDLLGSVVWARLFRCDAPVVDAPSLNAGPDPSPDPDERLIKLKSLFDKGLITKDEYDRRRAAILQSL